MEVDHQLEQKLFDISQKDFWIYKMSQVISYYNKTKDESWDFLDFPNKVEVLNDLEEYVELISDIVNSSKNSTKEDFFDFDVDNDKLAFIREELLNEMTTEVCSIIGELDSENEAFEKELKKIRIDEDRSFLRNVNKNIISNNNILKFFSSILFFFDLTFFYFVPLKFHNIWSI